MKSCCDMCMFYEYDEEYEEMVCIMNLDEDEMARFVMSGSKSCPYFRFGDE